ncbi:MAG TPA: response regulator [Desulfuromonadales bacterium]|nr:response regulator [Desulfuromonadales bacterium]
MTKQPEMILIVDDETDIAQVLKLQLEESGYITNWAADGETALQQLWANNYDLVLLDMRMPGISGVDVLRRIRDNCFDSAVIMMTAHGNESLVVECMKAGAADYVAKPFDLDDMMMRIERALENRRTVRLKKALEQEKDDFIFMLSHDMKNPLTAVIGSIDIVREGRLGGVSPEQAEYLQAAIESCQEVVTMIDNLLDMQRFDTGRMQSRISPVNPYALLETAVKHFSAAAERENITLILEANDITTEIAVDSSLLARVFANLIGNALQFVPNGGAISISCDYLEPGQLSNSEVEAIARTQSCSAAPGFVRIRVIDNGAGVSSDDLTNIFERYVQSDNTSKRSHGGAGLGLAFCKKAVESFDGSIWAESNRGEGGQFIILLPAHTNTTTSENSIPE